MKTWTVVTETQSVAVTASAIDLLPSGDLVFKIDDGPNGERRTLRMFAKGYWREVSAGSETTG